MKRKLKKLSLTTETLRSLSEPTLDKVAGGLTPAVDCTTTDNTRVCSLCTAACTVCCP